MGLFPSLPDIGAMLRRELAACVGHVVPPANARPIYWACLFDWTATGTPSADTRTMGVYWQARTDSVLGVPVSSYTVPADTPAPGEPVPAGMQIACEVSVQVARNANETGTLTTPPADLRQTWFIDGHAPQGLLRTFCGGDYAGYYAPGATVNYGSAGTGPIASKPAVPIMLQPGQRLTVTVESGPTITNPRTYKVLAMVRGWQWPTG